MVFPASGHFCSGVCFWTNDSIWSSSSVNVTFDLLQASVRPDYMYTKVGGDKFGTAITGVLTWTSYHVDHIEHAGLATSN